MKHILEIRVRLDAIEFAGTDERVQSCGDMATAFRGGGRGQVVRLAPIPIPRYVCKRTDSIGGNANTVCADETELRYVGHQSPQRKDASMNIHLALAPLVSLLAGILILIMPRLLNYIVALYLIIIGLIGLFGAGNFRF
jgi:hypothetical protein